MIGRGGTVSLHLSLGKACFQVLGNLVICVLGVSTLTGILGSPNKYFSKFSGAIDLIGLKCNYNYVYFYDQNMFYFKRFLEIPLSIYVKYQSQPLPYTSWLHVLNFLLIKFMLKILTIFHKIYSLTFSRCNVS